MAQGILAEMTLDDVRAFEPQVALSGIGSTEPHGPILTYRAVCAHLCAQRQPLAPRVRSNADREAAKPPI